MKYCTTRNVKMRLTDNRWSRTVFVISSLSSCEGSSSQPHPALHCLGTKGADFMATKLSPVQASQRSRASVCFDSFVHCNRQLLPVLEGRPEGPLRAPSISGRPLYFEPSYFSRVQMSLFMHFLKKTLMNEWMIFIIRLRLRLGK